LGLVLSLGVIVLGSLAYWESSIGLELSTYEWTLLSIEAPSSAAREGMGKTLIQANVISAIMMDVVGFMG
jgi:hypothetical protein